MDSLTLLCARLDVVRRQPDGFLARCPVPGHGKGHGDRHPSLSIRTSCDGVPLVKCHAGCPTEAVLDAVGLRWRDLYDTTRR